MNKIYVITASSGEYSDRCDWNVCAFTSEERAKEFSDKLVRLASYNNDFLKRKWDEFDCKYDPSHPHVGMPVKPLISAEFRSSQALLTNDKNKVGTPLTDNERVEFKAKFREAERTHYENLRLWNEECSRVSTINFEQSLVKEDALKVWREENYKPSSDLEEVMPYEKSTGYNSIRYDYELVEVL